MRTTVRLDDQLLRAAKSRAIDRGVTLTQVIEDALRAEFNRRTSPPAERRTLTTFRGRGAYPEVDLDDGAGLRDVMDGL